MIGRTISHYKILKKLGEGGMGIVYRAEDTKLGRDVALKFLPESALVGDEERARFMHEARAAASLNHPNICTIYEIEEYEGRPFIVMEFVDGRSMSSVIADGPLKLNEAIGIAMQTAEGLHAAHELTDDAGRSLGLVHRDFSPHNILVSCEGQSRLTDFGIALARTKLEQTSEGIIKGKPRYMAPEQAKGHPIDRRCDVWAAGVVAWEMLARRRLFKGKKEAEALLALVTGIPPRLRTVRPELPVATIRNGVDVERFQKLARWSPRPAWISPCWWDSVGRLMTSVSPPYSPTRSPTYTTGQPSTSTHCRGRWPNIRRCAPSPPS